MSDAALANAEAHKKQLLDRRLALHAEIAALDTQIEKTTEFIKSWHLFANGASELPTGTLTIQIENKKEQQHVNAPVKNSTKEDVAEVAREVILRRGSPILRDELYGLVTARGLTIQGKDPQMVMSTMLWRMKDRIHRVDGGGYWAAGVPNSAIGYDPERHTRLVDILNTPTGEILDPESDEHRDASKNAG